MVGEFIITLRLASARRVPVGRGMAPPRSDCPGRSVCARIYEFAMDKISNLKQLGLTQEQLRDIGSGTAMRLIPNLKS